MYTHGEYFAKLEKRDKYTNGKYIFFVKNLIYSNQIKDLDHEKDHKISGDMERRNEYGTY